MPPPPPSLQPPLFPVNSDAAIAEHHSSYNPSFLIIAAIIAAAIVAASSIHLLLRVLSRSRSPPSIHNLPSPSSTSPSPPSPSCPDPTAVIHSLPIFSLSSLKKLTRSDKSTSIDCAVCLSAFQTADELRLLPSCRHVFHSKCIDTWLSSNLTCPLCRASIRHVSPSQSFKVEIGSVSLRSTSSAADAVRSRSYSIGSSFEYVVEGEIDAVVSRIQKREINNVGPAGPGDDVAAGIGGRSSWLKEYIDRLASSASSSFSSLRWSGRRNDNINNSNSLNDNYSESNWDLERNLHMHLEEEDGGFGTFYRWLVGV